MYNSLRNQKNSIIAECKKASPSSGIIKNSYDPLKIAEIYERCGASAISVLTDKKFFQGSLIDLQKVSQLIKLPVLRKDFIIHEKQIYEARHYGASAILLIVRILSPSQLQEFIQISSSINMDSLVEIHTEEETSIAIEAGAKIIGINTRDLNTFQIHQDLVKKISPFIPDTIIKVGESGIKSQKDYLGMIKYVDATLIGTYFMKASNIELAFSDLYHD